MGRNRLYIVPAVLVGAVGVAGAILANTNVKAESTSANAAVIVPSACSFSSTLDSAHSATIPATQYKADIGKTTFNVICNDSGGFAIYAVGNSGGTFGNNKLLATVGGELMPSYDIATGTATSGSTSNWAMKLTAVSGTHTPTIVSPYSNYAAVPSTYTKVASYASATDGSVGASLESTYAAYIAGSQPAGTYNGKVKYTMVHPASEVPAQPQTTESGQICYYANASDAVGTMGCQSVASSVTLLASNFSRNGYGFAGWSDAFDYKTNENAKFYGPQETITLTPADYQSPNNGLSLYAVWVKSAGNLQDTNKVAELCGTGTNALTTAPTDGTADLDSVSALTDQRDNNTYAIAKLADGNCWMIENLRLESTNSDNSTGNLAQGYGGQFAGLADAEPAWANNITTANSLYSTDGADSTINIGTSNASYRFPRYNHDNTNSRASSPTTNSTAMYSYGNYYTWAAAIADTTAYTSNNTSVTNTSICPSGWRLPKGGQTTVNTTADFYLLGKAIMNNIEPDQNASGGYGYYGNSVTNTAGKTATAAFRSYPNNFVYSGGVSSGSVSGRGSYGYYWSSTAYSSYNAYYLNLYSSLVYPGTNNYYKYRGWTVRCVVSGV